MARTAPKVATQVTLLAVPLVERLLKQLDGIGSDLTSRGSTGAPTIRFKEPTVSGA